MFCILEEYERHEYIVNSLSDYNKRRWDTIMSGNAVSTDLKSAIFTLMKFLCNYHKKQVVILIDEYDTPIISAHKYGYYDKAILFFRNMLGMALKDNSFLEKGVLTGILRIAKEGIFSGLNNLSVFSMLDSELSDKFGFTENEVQTALKNFRAYDNKEQVKQWYDGYNVYDVTIYNPWSIINFLKNQKFGTYWVNTGENALANELVNRQRLLVQENLDALIEGKEVLSVIDQSISLQSIEKREEAVWTILFFAGYLTVFKTHDAITNQYYMKIPNQEVISCFKTNVAGWINDAVGTQKVNIMLDALIAGDIEKFQEFLRFFVENIFSYHDIPENESEKLYHIFFLGLLINLESR